MEPQLIRGDNTTGQISMNIRDLEDEIRATTLSNKRKLPLLKSETWLSGQNVTANIFIKQNIRQTRCIWRTIVTPGDTDPLYYILRITIDYDSDRVFFNEIKGACLEHADALVAVAKKQQDTIVRRLD